MPRAQETINPWLLDLDAPRRFWRSLPRCSHRHRSFNALVAPNEMFIKVLNRNLNLQRYKVLYICGNYCSILSRLDHWFQDLEIRRAFTASRLTTILEETTTPRSSLSMILCSRRTQNG